MLLGEELLLLLLDDDHGGWLVPRRAVARGLRVALVAELLGRGALRIDESWHLAPHVGASTGGDPVLDRVCERVAGRPVTEVVEADRRAVRALLARLRDAGVLRRTMVRRRHVPRDTHPEAMVRSRLLGALRGAKTDRHTALLVSLVSELHLLGVLFPDEDAAVLRSRAAEIEDQLRHDPHHFPATLEEERSGRTSAGEILEGIGDVFVFTEAVGGLARLAWLPIRALAELIDFP